MNVSACVIVVGFGVALAYLGVDIRSVWLVVLSVAIVVIGAWVACRCLTMRISLDADTLHIVGYLRSRHIPRTAILSVEQSDLATPLVRWSSVDGTDRWSTLTPLTLGSSSLLPGSMYLRRYRFLAHLRRWAPDADTSDVRLGTWSRIASGLAAAFGASAGSPPLRIALAASALAVAAGTYWWGIASMLSVLDGSYQPASRGWFVPLAVSAFATEGVYWLLPLRARRPRAWHVVLVALMAPLGVLTLVALFA